MSTSVERIRSLNDAFRSSFAGGAIVCTQGVLAIEEDVRRKLMSEIRAFEKWEKGNDPFAEHDFGSVVIDGERFFFKIDYYAHDLKHSSEDPSDPAKTRRVMTIMLASEY